MAKADAKRRLNPAEIVLLVILVGLVGFVGWYVYDSNKQVDETLKSTQANQKQAPPKVNKPEKVATIAILGHTFEPASIGGIDVAVELKNNDTEPHDVTVKVTFKNPSGQILEEPTNTLKNLAPGATDKVLVNGTNKVESFSDIKVEVTKVY